MKIEKNHICYKNADNCKKCPGKNGPDGCPWWWTYKKKNPATQEEIIYEECGKSSLPFFLDFVCMSSQQPAAEMSMMREQVVRAVRDGFVSLSNNDIAPKLINLSEEKDND